MQRRTFLFGALIMLGLSGAILLGSQGGGGGGGQPTATDAPSEVDATRVLAYDTTNDWPLYERDISTTTALGSLTKMMTALLLMEHKGDSLSEVVTVTQADIDDASGTLAGYQDGDDTTFENLLNALLIPSGGEAAFAISRVIGDFIQSETGSGNGGNTRFVEEMNAKATALGMDDTSFDEPEGGSTGSAEDMLTLMQAAFADATIEAVAKKASETITVTGANARTFDVDHTSPLLANDSNLGATKTSFAIAVSNGYHNVQRWESLSGDTIDIVIMNDTDNGRYGATQLIIQKLQIDFAYLGLPNVASDTDPGAHRYWRVANRFGGNSGGFISIGEVEFREKADGPDHTNADTSGALASSGRTGFEAAKAFDHSIGANTLFWSPQQYEGMPAWVGYDFGSAVSVGEVKLIARDDFSDQMVRDFDLEHSDDGSAWTTAWSVRGEAAYSNGEERQFPANYAAAYAPGTHRYWRCLIQSGGNGSFYGLAEIEMRATAGGADQTGSGTAIASGERSGFEDDLAFDDDTGTIWSVAQSAGQWIGYDFGNGNDLTIAEVAITARNDSFFEQAPRKFDLEYSDDGSAWTRAASFYPVAAYSQGETKVFTADYA